MKKLPLTCLALILMMATVFMATPLLTNVASAATKEEIIQQEMCQKTENTDCFQDAQNTTVNEDCASAGTGSCNVITKYINPLIAFIGILGGVAVAIGIIVGGIQYASSGGDPQQAASGKRHIKAAVIGLIGLLFMWAFISFLFPGGVTG